MSDPTLTFLEQVKNNLESIDYELIYQSIADLGNKFIPTAIIKKGSFIDRVRINKPNEIFTNIDQVSYIHDKYVLDNYVTYGRANLPHQAIFYGSIISPKIKTPRIVAYFETSELLKELDKHDNAEEVFTLSRWKVLEDIHVLEMIFSEDALKVSDYCKMSLENQMKNYKHLPLANHYEKQGLFFSNEFSRTDVGKGEVYKYKITSAYANYIWNNSQIKGITYPSVQSSYLGQNVALLPEVVNKYLKLDKLGMFKFERRNKKNLPIDSFKLATDLGENFMNFQWYDYIGKDNQ